MESPPISSPTSSTSKIPSNWAAKWTPEEDQRLLNAIEVYGENNWRKVAEVVGTREAVKCLQRWEKGLKPGIVKGRWTEDEDRTLVYIVSQGYKNWGQVAAHMPGRTSKQCRERWNNYLDPTLLHTPFSAEEDQILLKLQAENGNKWAHIARSLPGRTENAVKLRFNHLTKTPNPTKSPLPILSNSHSSSMNPSLHHSYLPPSAIMASNNLVNMMSNTTIPNPTIIPTSHMTRTMEDSYENMANKRPRVNSDVYMGVDCNLSGMTTASSSSISFDASLNHAAMPALVTGSDEL